MPIAQADLTQAILVALQGVGAVQQFLPSYNNSIAIFTRRPIPPDAPYPMIVVSPDITKNTDFDGYTDQRPRITRDVIVYGKNDRADHYRVVEQVAYAVFDTFHRSRMALDGLVPSPWMVSDIICSGPIPAPTDDDLHVGRAVAVEVHLAAIDP